jgi:hypothetical protein
MDDLQQREWANLWKGISEICAQFEQRPIFIGGVAVYLHLVDHALEGKLGEFSHDGDLLMSLADFADLRDLHEVTPNRRLGKNQVIRHGIDFDIYVERRYQLAVPFDDAMAESKVINQVRVASLEHLLVLKLEASADRQGSEKGLKDERDLIRLCVLMNDTGYKQALILPYLRDPTIDILKGLQKSSQFLALTGKNAHEARPLRISVEKVTNAILREHRKAIEPK